MPESINMRVKPLLVISLLIILLTTGVSCFNQGENGSQGSFSDFNITDVEGEYFKLQERAVEAQTKALDWQSDAFLFAINVVFENTEISQDYKPVLYFASEQDGYQNDYIVELEPDFSALSNWEELPRTEEDVDEVFYEIYDGDWLIGYAEALKIAEENGGSEFRSGYSNYQIILDLYKNYQVGLEWGVYYTAMISATEYDNLSIYMDAVHGEITEITS